MGFSKKEITLFFSLLFAISLPIYGQMYTVPSSGFTSYTVCSGTLYDAMGRVITGTIIVVMPFFIPALRDISSEYRVR